MLLLRLPQSGSQPGGGAGRAEYRALPARPAPRSLRRAAPPRVMCATARAAVSRGDPTDTPSCLLPQSGYISHNHPTKVRSRYMDLQSSETG